MHALSDGATALLVPLLFLIGGYFFCRAGLVFLRHPRRVGRALARERGRGSARSLALALAGTLGVGNIAGVATAIALGGAGAVFWMWLSAFFAMFLKYAEIVLALATRRFDEKGRAHGGAMYYMENSFGKAGRATGKAFAALCCLCALTLGGVIQSSAAAEAMRGAFGVPALLTGALMGGGAALVLRRGGEKIEAFCAAIVPFVCALFTLASVAVLILRRAALPAAFAAIFRGAFSPRGALGGAAGVLTSGAVRYGVTRGLISNEAGCGTAPIAHAGARVKSPAVQGIWGIFEVFVDTMLLCTMTALVILTSGVRTTGEEGVMLAVRAYGASLGKAAAPILSLSILFFAFATLLCWSHYGAEGLRYLTGKEPNARPVAAGVFAASVCGAAFAPAFLWEMTDLVIALMALMNVAALFACRRRVIKETRAAFGAVKKN